MSALLLERLEEHTDGRPGLWVDREIAGVEPGAERERGLPEAMRAHGRFTLDELLTGVWEDLAVRAVVRCPVCSGRMTSRELAGRSSCGICLDCGTRLS